MSEASGRSTDPRVEAALQEYLDRIDRGEIVEREGFLAVYPDISEGLRNLIAAEEQLRKLAGDKASQESAGAPTQSFTAQGEETVLTSSQANDAAAEGGLQGRFGRYQIVRLLGKGAMGSVYLAQDTQLKRDVAIKTPHFKDDPTGELLRRFYREAESAATLRHANICPVYDVGQIDGKHFISMAYIEGKTLHEVVHRGKAQSERQVVIAVYKLARALQHAHDQGIVHRDLKPANIMVGKQGEPIIMDFGLARTRHVEGEASLTQSGVILGSPAYMSPEQVDGEADGVGAAADQYSLGVVLFEMLTGRLPFRGSIASVLAQILTSTPTPPSELRPGLDPRIEAICLRMMAKQASDRFPTMQAAADELARVLKNPAMPTAAEESSDVDGSTESLAASSGIASAPQPAVSSKSTATSGVEAGAALGSGKRPWIRWGILAVGLVLLGAMYAVIVIYLGKSAIVIDIRDPNIEVSVKGNTATITGPNQQTVKVTPGDQELVITSPGLETTTKSFSLKKGETRTVTVSILDRELVARLENEAAAPAGKANPQAAAASAGFFEPYLVRGDWKIENDELVQPRLTAGYAFDFDDPQIFPLICFGDDTLSDYDLTLDIKKTGGLDVVGVFFHWLGRGHCRTFLLEKNRAMTFSCFADGTWDRKNAEWKEWNYTSNRWYSLKIQVRGSTYRLYVNNDLQFERTDERFTHGRICLTTFMAAGRFRRIKVADPKGNVLFEGLPQLPNSSDSPTQRPQPANAAQPLTSEETAAKEKQNEHAKLLNARVISKNSIGIELALIPPAQFQMGFAGVREGNAPEHRVQITKPYHMGVYEVTQQQFETILKRNTSWFQNAGGESEQATSVDTSQYPVEGSTWYDAVEFCNRLSEVEGQRPYYRIEGIQRGLNDQIIRANVTIVGGDGYRLPTEAEWEYACRAGTTTRYSFGTVNNCVECNCNGRKPDGANAQGPWLGQTIPVGSYRPNAFGLYDMHGNASEWCWDLYDEDYYNHSPPSDPTGPASGTKRIYRGGVYSYSAAYCASAQRSDLPPDYNFPGFRVARNFPVESDIEDTGAN